MTVYYVNSGTGSDRNSGTSETSAFASLKAIENVKLQPGDSVLLSADSVFVGERLFIKTSGSEGNPITFGKYGDGPGPVITGGDVGIHGPKTSNIVIENITITKTGGNAIYAGGSSNWTVDNVTITDTGSVKKAGSISFQNSENMAVINSTISGVHNDGIWMENVKGATVANTKITNSIGHTADALQMHGSSNILISGNTLDMTGNNGSSKGVLVLGNAKNAVVEGNVLTGGGFGMGIYGENIVIKGNDVSGYKGYSWSFGIGLGSETNAKNYTITDNYVHDGKWGVAITSPAEDKLVREGINVSGNIFGDLTGAAIKVDRPVQGSFNDNIVENGVISTYISSTAAALKKFEVGVNTKVESIISHIDKILGADTSVPVVIDPTTTKSITPPAAGTGDDAGSIIGTPPAANVLKTIFSAGPSGFVESGVSSQAPVSDGTPLVVLPSSKYLKATNDVIRVDHTSDTLVITGNILDNDTAGNGNVTLRRFGNTDVDKYGETIVSKHGTVHIELDGDFSYTINIDSLTDHAGIVSDRFQYKISNGASSVDTGYLTLQLDSHALIAHYDAGGFAL